MTRSAMFVDQERKAVIRRWYGTFRARIPVATDDIVVETSFGKTHALIAGPAGAPTLVVLHGALASSAHVLPEIGSLLRSRRVYALDVIGQSVMSEDRRLDLSDDSYGRWLLEATMALGLDRFDLLGVSWGGFVALRAACVAPERVSNLVLVVPAGWVANGAWAGLRDSGWALLAYRAFPSHERLLRLVRTIFTTLDSDWTAYFGDALRCYRFDLRIPPLARPADVAPITCPTLVFGADHDVQFPGLALIKRAKALIPHAEVELLANTRHSPPLTDEFRARLSERIERFLDAPVRS